MVLEPGTHLHAYRNGGYETAVVQSVNEWMQVTVVWDSDGTTFIVPIAHCHINGHPHHVQRPTSIDSNSKRRQSDDERWQWAGTKGSKGTHWHWGGRRFVDSEPKCSRGPAEIGFQEEHDASGSSGRRPAASSHEDAPWRRRTVKLEILIIMWPRRRQ